MARCVTSVQKHLPDARIYLSDGGRMTNNKQVYYTALQAQGHWVQHYDEFNVWWRKVFNEKAQVATEDYILKLDDDFVIENSTNIDTLLQYIQNDPKLGLLGCKVYHEHRKENSVYIYDVVETDAKSGKYRLAFTEQPTKGYKYCDFVPDCWVARREIFEKVKMDPTLRPAQGGHENFFSDIYMMRERGDIDWRVGFTNDVVMTHEKGSQSDEYKRHRSAGMHDYYRNIRVIRPGHEKQDRA